ncbi:ATP-binding protein [Jeotgalicoccus huakuii]|nr:ATP-binding protein [Jeotgalicoccus huakuii]
MELAQYMQYAKMKDSKVEFTGENCETCKRPLKKLTKYFQDGTEETTITGCICKATEKVNAIQNDLNTKKFINASVIDIEYQNAQFEDLKVDTDQQAKAIEVAKDYINNFDDKLKNGRGLVIQGSFGTGKTYLSAIIRNALIKENYKVLFIKFADYFDMMVTTSKDTDGKTDGIYYMAKDADLLILDEVNAEQNNWEAKELYKITDARMNKSTIYTTNYSSKDFKKSMKMNQIFTRMMNRKDTIILNGKDYRIGG